ncbi:MAG TPA: SDR family NAD(P)-dependent oxidoreductase [Myxococcota bacterium]|nr:SDR family NAD(P)-dependent oxidoreductase [Myxococcota bacterium]
MAQVRAWWRAQRARRPGWMNAVMLFCAFMAFVYVPWDLLAKPVARDEEVWLGFRLHGFAAKLTEPFHWAIYAALTYGFWRMRPWMWPWAGVYAGVVAASMLVWSLLYGPEPLRLAAGLAAAAPFLALQIALLRSRPRFRRRETELSERYPGWAVITGASAGIGAEFARKLATAGFSCVLVARREDRLRTLAEELEKRHGIATRIVATDLAADGGPQRVADAVSDLDVSLLVNNAGFGLAGRFEAQDPGRLREMVLLNCLAPTLLARLLLPQLRRRPRAAMIVTGSASGRQPLPLHAVYAATKAFDQLLGEALWAELREHGVDVLVLEPASTESEFHHVAGELPHAGAPASEVVDAALDALGQVPSIVPGWYPWLRANAGMRLLPRSLLALAARGYTVKQTPEERR